jgi:hypothetical protein
MTARFHPGYRPQGLLLVLIVTLLGGAAVRGQDPPPGPKETPAVMRIHRRLIDDVTTREIKASIPFRAVVVKADASGVIQGVGRTSVEILPNDRESVFVVSSRGSAQADVTATRGPFYARGPAFGPFTSRTVVRFVGRRFTNEGTSTWAEVYGILEEVGTRRGGHFSRLIGRMAWPFAQALIPRAEREGVPYANHYLREFVDNLAARIIERLNRTTPLEQSVARVYPETKDWIYRLSATGEYIQGAVGPPDAVVPTLPDSPNLPKDLRVELWLRTTQKEAKFLEALGRLKLAGPLLREYLKQNLPEIGRLNAELSVTAVGTWLVIGIGELKEE